MSSNKGTWVVEYSPHSARIGMHPWHIGRLGRSIRINRQRMSPSWENVWMPVFVGTWEECNEEINTLRAEVVVAEAQEKTHPAKDKDNG